ncbi:glycosyltransferase family 52 [Allomuricauda sp. AC10]|uniref:glycosyltransferase family 52 n=1 Tax=Flavobacteriaceae TaxID=49546 RepID=UPI00234AE7E7|nr:glycosyltransferase family 52 [Muricauda sp. AC10]
MGSTIYHIYLSILHIIKDSGHATENVGENILFLVESTPMIEKLIPNLKNHFFRDIYIISERKDHVKALGKFNYALRRKKKLIPYLEKTHPELILEAEFMNSSDFYLCDSDSSKSYFLYKYGKKGLNMIEDGARTYRQRHTGFEQFLKSHITKTPIGGGFDKEIKTLHAQFPQKLPFPIQKKAVELNIKKETELLNEASKHEIFNIFIPTDSISIQGTKLALILTQPLSEDKVVKDENVKLEIYRDMISKVPKDMTLVLKTHPREKTKYEHYFRDIVVLPALFPIEILGLRQGFHFEQGYTLFSTALSNLEIVQERFFLGKNYLDKFTARGTRDLVKNMSFDQ